MNGEPRRLHLSDVIATAESLYGLEPGSIVARCRPKEVVDVRRLVMFVARAWLEMSFPLIGRIMGRDHSTIIHNVKEMQGLIARDRSRLQDVRELVAAAMLKAEVGRLSPAVFAQRMRLFLQADEIRRRPAAEELEVHR